MGSSLLCLPRKNGIPAIKGLPPWVVSPTEERRKGTNICLARQNMLRSSTRLENLPHLGQIRQIMIYLSTAAVDRLDPHPPLWKVVQADLHSTNLTEDTRNDCLL